MAREHPVNGCCRAAAALSILLAAACLQESDPRYTVGILNHASVAEGSIEGFKDYMSWSGLPEGEEGVTYLYSGPVTPEELESEAERLVDGGADLILSVTMPATVAALRAGVDQRVPVVFAPNSNPVAAGIVGSMEHPGGNVTGVSFWLQEEKRLEWLVRIVPGVQRVLVPYMDWDRSPRIEIRKLEEVARRLGLQIVARPIGDPSQMAAAAREAGDGVDAVFIPADALVESNAPLFVAEATPRGIPVTSPQSYGFQSGALFAYGFDQYDTGRQGARLALQVLRGEAKAGEIPVEMADTKLMINLRAAGTLGIEIPPEIISMADRVLR